MLRVSVTSAIFLLVACRPVQDPPAANGQAPIGASQPAIPYTAPFDGEPVASQTLDNGVRIDDFVVGDGRDVAEGSIVRIHFTGYLLDGRVFENTREEGRRTAHQMTIGSGRGLPGLHSGLVGMKAGGKRRLYLPSEQAYGRNRYKIVQPGSSVILTVELVGVDVPLADPQPESAFNGEAKWTETRGEGLVVSELREGTGAPAQGRDRVAFHYVGKLEDGSVFDTSHEREPFEIELDSERVIQGLRLGLDGAKEGALRKLTVPPQLGFGDRKSKNVPPGSTVTYLVEVMRVRPAEG